MQYYRRRKLQWGMLGILAAIGGTASGATLVYVDASASGANSGANWANAYTDLQDAITEAESAASNLNPYTIWVANGTYRPSAPGTSETLWTFLLPQWAEFYGGFAGGEGALEDRDPATNVATLDGRVASDAYNVVAVVTVDDLDPEEPTAERRLDGFTVKNPLVNEQASLRRDIVVQDGAAALVTLVVRDGYASTTGGGIRINSADSGTRVVCCQVVDNEAKRHGAGIAVLGPVQILNSLIAFNTLTECPPPPSACGFDDGGAGIFDSADSGFDRSIINCTIAENVTNVLGGGVHLLQTSGLEIVNSIIWGNRDHANNPSEIEGSPTVSYSDVRGGYTGTGNIDDDPEFEDPGNGDFRLASGSPCLDVGLSAEVPADDLDVDDDDDTLEPTPDLDRAARILPATSGECPEVDMGAFERTTENDCLTGDLNSDCEVDGADLGLLLAAWSGSGAADLNCDGTVDGADLGTLLAGWTGTLESPRDCGCESLGGGSGDESSAMTSSDLCELFGFETAMELAMWLATLEFAEMEAYLKLLMQ